MPVETQTIRSIFLAAVENHTPDQWPAFLDEVCKGDANQRREVENLLQAHVESNSLLDNPESKLEATISQLPRERPGTLIGRYKLLEQVGEGGMGVVFVAEQTEPVRRRVALKIIKPGMDTKQVIARFEAERQALAMMDHPNIAKVLDAGTTDAGRPYFVMELVRGMPITEYCDKVRLSPRQRLDLFVDVCHATQHAHQKGIIHRDLKPSNVLITLHDGTPVVKVIDFGVAKAVGQQLTERTVYTALTQLVGTPLYMSPEQAEMSGLDVDTRSDVYSLGVLLYELLTGQTPFDKETLARAGLDEMRRIIREDEPLRPSRRFSTLGVQAISTASQHRGVDERRLSKILCGELDWIVMKALEKDRSRRYESASALAADIQRYLSDEPVLACPPTTMYRFQKFARKHKPALVTAAAVAACLILGTTVSAWQAIRATAAETQAAANEVQAKQAATAEAQQRQRAEANEQKANANAAEAQARAKEATEQRDDAQKQRDEVKALAEKLAAKEEELERTQYADHIYMAKEAWDSGNVTRATSLLKQHLPKPGEPDRRGFEWHYLSRTSQLGPLVSINTGLGIGPSKPVLSPDRTRLIRFIPRAIPPGTNKFLNPMRPNLVPTLKVWNLQTGQEELSAALSGVPNNPGPGNMPIFPVFSPDATRMTFHSTWDYNTNAYVPTDVKVWNTLTGKEILSCSGVVERVAFSSDGKLFATPVADQTIKLWDLETAQESSILKGQLELPHALAFSPDGRRLAAAGNKWDKMKKVGVGGEIKIWDVQTGNLVQTLKGHSEWMHQLVFSPDGQWLASCAEGTGLIKLWDINANSEPRTFKLLNGAVGVDELQFSADGTRLIGHGYKKEQEDYVDYTKMWNTQTGQELLSFKNCSLEFTSDGKRVAVTDESNVRIKVFDAQSGQQIMNLPGGGAAFSPDSKRLAVQSNGLRILDMKTGDEINYIKCDASGTLAFSLDGRRLIVNRGSLGTQVWDVEAKQESSKTITFPGLGRQWGLASSSSAVFNSDLTRLAAIASAKVKLFDLSSGQELRTLSGHKNNVKCVAISPDGKRVASCDGGWASTGTENPGIVKVWDADAGSELFTIQGHERSLYYLAFSADGKKLAGSVSNRTVKIWDAKSGAELRTLGASSDVIGPISNSRLVFSPDSKRVAGAGKIWDVETGEELVTLKGAAQDSISFSPDGKRVAGGGGGPSFSLRDGTRTRQGASGSVSDAQTGDVLFTIPASDDRSGHAWFAFSPDGRRLASSSGIWDAQTGQELFNFGGKNQSGQVAFSADGHRLAIIPLNGDAIVTIYDATPLP